MYDIQMIIICQICPHDIESTHLVFILFLTFSDP